MNLIKPEKWSSEWYELATTDELITVIKEVRHFLEIGPRMSHTNRSLWEERIKKISEELTQRGTSGDDWQEP